MDNLTKVIFVCDESGAKGYANQDESYPGEVGVFSGILIADECVGAASEKFQEIYDQYKPASGKLHIADLPNHLQEALRQDIYQIISHFRLPCFWYAIHVAGLHASHKSMDAIAQTAKNRLREASSGNEQRIKSGSPRTNPASMHLELFSGLYGHLIAFLEERERKEVDIEIRTDQIDDPIVNKFETFAKELLSEHVVINKRTGFDTVTSKIVNGEIKVELKFPPEMNIEVVVRSLSINPVRDGDGFVLAADVLANSLNHLFKNRKNNELYSALNTPEAVATHPLAKHLDAFIDWGKRDLVGDCLYKHPKAQQD